MKKIKCGGVAAVSMMCGGYLTFEPCFGQWRGKAILTPSKWHLLYTVALHFRRPKKTFVLDAQYVRPPLTLFGVLCALGRVMGSNHTEVNMPLNCTKDSQMDYLFTRIFRFYSCCSHFFIGFFFSTFLEHISPFVRPCLEI